MADRVERIGLATLYLGDCREIMPALEADVIVTDPVWPNCPADSIPGWQDPWGLWREACALMPATKRIVAVVRADSDPRFFVHLPPLPFFRSILLPYVIPGYIGRKLGGDEMAYWFGSPIAPAPGRMLIPGRGPSAQPGGRKANGHPMSRAQRHFDWLVGWCADAGETVLDPFMGSGTTGVAAVKNGLPFVGCEVHPPFFDLACRRLEDAQRQADLFLARQEPSHA
ncbi:DNA methyltransferase [Roseomonas sp. USHLN139]|uniref:DNA methyltransferase n=1 Tax=Roseomonas sp. USHLN139 TaxID=3081298 RepID=UPI003B0145D3